MNTHQGKNLEALVKADKRTAQEVADKMDYHRTTLYDLFKLKEFDDQQLKKIGKIYDLTKITSKIPPPPVVIDNTLKIQKLEKEVENLNRVTMENEEDLRLMNKKINALYTDLANYNDALTKANRLLKQMNEKWAYTEPKKAVVRRG